MKKLLLVVVSGFVFLVSCQKKQEYLTKEQLEHKSDSLTEIRFKELEAQAAEDLDRRMAIEIKPKVDSILEKNKITVTTTSSTIISESPEINPMLLDSLR